MYEFISYLQILGLDPWNQLYVSKGPLDVFLKQQPPPMASFLEVRVFSESSPLNPTALVQFAVGIRYQYSFYNKDTLLDMRVFSI